MLQREPNVCACVCLTLLCPCPSLEQALVSANIDDMMRRTDELETTLEMTSTPPPPSLYVYPSLPPIGPFADSCACPSRPRPAGR